MTQRSPLLLPASALALAGVSPAVTAALPAGVAVELPGTQWTGSARLRFFGIWWSDVTSESELRRGLLSRLAL